jgi:2-succinyl-5-enolpyruvyl-6-hydroxy-3-cyclohexene-1-carboxylate synthase
VIKPENRNILWATILADELARCGVHHAVIAPGSRSTPLAVAFSRDDRFTIHSIIDERAAAFFALGIGKASGMPAVVICTSGTAAANFFPAIIEASMSNVPMIVMTADRPHELRDSGANQTIDQVKLYGGYVRWFVDVAPPHAIPEDKTLRYLRTMVDRAVAYTQGANGGPVHLNVPFEKPLEPVVVEGDVPTNALEVGTRDAANPSAQIKEGLKQLTNPQLESIVRHLRSSPQGIIVCGPDVSLTLIDPLTELARLVEYPILAGGNFKLFNTNGKTDYHVLAGYETFLSTDFGRQFQPEIILQIGSLPIGTALLNYLQNQDKSHRIVISEKGDWSDDSHLTDTLICADVHDVICRLNQWIRSSQSGSHERWAIAPYWIHAFLEAEHLTWNVVDQLGEPHEGQIIADIVASRPSHLFVANSNPSRHFEQFVRPQAMGPRVHFNRGVSGIDGTVATALGTFFENDKFLNRSVLVIGDLALYHDLNSLHLIRRLNIPLVIVCINNDGGGIFHRLPIANYEPPFRELFVTPHGLTFEHAAKMFDIPYTLANMGEDFRAAFKAALDSGEPHLIEVPSDAAEFERQRKQLIDTVAQRIAESGILEKFKASQEKHSQGSTHA